MKTRRKGKGEFLFEKKRLKLNPKKRFFIDDNLIVQEGSYLHDKHLKGGLKLNG